jgi:NADPH:quinone reductase-like Zn-dependent oxidoreductase
VIREQALPTIDDLGDRGVLIKVHAWSMNPCDAILQTTPLSFVKYPVILGQDVAGTVEAVKPESTAASKFQVGDRIFGFTANNGFQDYVTLDYTLMAKIPGDIPNHDAVIFGLTSTTSSFSLFGKDFLHLDYPVLGAAKKGKTLLVWGGSSAAGSNAIQLATGAGYDVITTCSASNFEYVKNLGAVKAFDYSSPTVIEDVVAEVDKRDCVGIYMAAGSNAAACQVSAASRQEVGGDGPLLSITPSLLKDITDRCCKLFVVSSNPVVPTDVPEGVRAKFTFGTGIGADAFAETLPATFGGYLPQALATGVYKIAPPPRVVNKRGLEGIQEALDLMKKGVSATKLVVERS